MSKPTQQELDEIRQFLKELQHPKLKIGHPRYCIEYKIINITKDSIYAFSS